MQYGNIKFSGNNGILYFLEPGQSYTCSSTNPWEGYQILIHPDIYKKYLSEKDINTYNFFSYEVNESLLLNEEEENTINLLMNEAWKEFKNKDDSFSIPIILSLVSSLLNYSERFYSRQFYTRKTMCNQLLSDFFKLLKMYYSNNDSSNNQPTLHAFADKLNVTPNYLSDTIKHHTGKSALNIIHDHIIEEAKKLLATTKLTVSEISDQLGFEYANYFSRLFKKKNNLSPTEYRKSVNSI